MVILYFILLCIPIGMERSFSYSFQHFFGYLVVTLTTLLCRLHHLMPNMHTVILPMWMSIVVLKIGMTLHVLNRVKRQ